MSRKDDRICEIGCVEICDLIPTGRTFHAYIDPKKPMPRGAEDVHGLSDVFLRGKPVFRQVLPAFLAFIGDLPLVAHNGTFDMGMVNAELERLGRDPLVNTLVDTLPIARKQRPGQMNGLDFLAKDFKVDASKRTKHGALIDAEILAGVYLHLRGGPQQRLALNEVGDRPRAQIIPLHKQEVSIKRRRRITREEFERHKAFVRDMGEKAIWLQHEIYARHLKDE